MKIRDRIVDLRRVLARDLRPDPRNWRTHPKAQKEALQGLLSEIGYADALLARETPEGLVLIDGHLRAETTPDSEVPVLVLDVDEREAGKLLASLDPLAAMAGADDERLAEILRSVETDSEAVQAMFAGLARDAGITSTLAEIDAEPRIDEAEDLKKKWGVERGQLWALGANRLMCGDSTNGEDVKRLLDGAMPRLLLTDPPYGVQLDMEWRDRAGLNGLGPAEDSYMKRAEGHKNVSISGDTRADWSEAFELVPSLDTAYVWHASAFSIEVGLGLRRIGFDLKQQIVWLKPHFVLSRQHYHWQHEPCWYARKPGAARFRGSRDQSTIWEAASPKMLMNPAGEREAKVDHPTQKPVVLYTRPIENHLEANETFYEPFAGSGTAIVAAEQTQRRCLAMEVDPKFVGVVLQRYTDATGKTPALIDDKVDA